MNRRICVFAGIMSLFTLGANWTFVVYMSRTGCINAIKPPRNFPQGLKPLILLAVFGTTEVVPFQIRFMQPVLEPSFAILMVVGVALGVYAGLRQSKLWFAIAGLNLFSYLLELAVS
jgi:hypothetical protein